MTEPSRARPVCGAEPAPRHHLIASGPAISLHRNPKEVARLQNRQERFVSARAVTLVFGLVFEIAEPGHRRMVFVGNRANQNAAAHTKRLFRIVVPPVRGKELISYLAEIESHQEPDR